MNRIHRGFDLSPEKPGQFARKLGDIEKIIVHRSLWTPGAADYRDRGLTDNAESVAHLFVKNVDGAGEKVGHRPPYDLVIDPRGMITQFRPLVRYGSHCKGANKSGIGIACIGDFRRLPTTEEQLRALEDLVAALCRFRPWSIRGHDEIEGGSEDAGKRCPGRHLSMSKLRRRVQSINETVGGWWLLDAGLVF